MVHVPGTKHQGADAASRHPVGIGEHLEVASLSHINNQPSQEPERLSKVFLRNLRKPGTEEEVEDSLDMEQRTLGHGMTRLAQLNWRESVGETDSKEKFTMAMLNTNSTPNICSMFNPSPISWQDVEDASAKDETTLTLNRLIMAGTPNKRDRWPESLAEYHRHRDHLSTIGPVVLYKGRAVLPASLRKEALKCSTQHTKESQAWSAEQHKPCSGLLLHPSHSHH